MDAVEKAKKPFMRGDILVYTLLLFLSLILFIVTLDIKNEQSNGFSVYFDGVEILKCDFENKSVTVIDNSIINKIDDNNYTISTSLGVNEIEIDFTKSSVSVVDTDCGLSKECMYMNYSDGIIVCAPHKIVIRPTNLSGELIIG